MIKYKRIPKVIHTFHQEFRGAKILELDFSESDMVVLHSPDSKDCDTVFIDNQHLRSITNLLIAECVKRKL